MNKFIGIHVIDKLGRVVVESKEKVSGGCVGCMYDRLENNEYEKTFCAREEAPIPTDCGAHGTIYVEVTDVG